MTYTTASILLQSEAKDVTVCIKCRLRTVHWFSGIWRYKTVIFIEMFSSFTSGMESLHVCVPVVKMRVAVLRRTSPISTDPWHSHDRWTNAWPVTSDKPSVTVSGLMIWLDGEVGQVLIGERKNILFEWNLGWLIPHTSRLMWWFYINLHEVAVLALGIGWREFYYFAFTLIL